MDRLSDDHVMDLLEELCDYISQYPPPNLQFEKVVVRQQGHFEVLAMGWKNDYRIHTPILHIEYRNQKIFVYYNGTDIDFDEWLNQRGIPREMVKPAHLPPAMLQLIDKNSSTST